MHSLWCTPSPRFGRPSGFVDEGDSDAYDDPLEEVGDGLVDGQLEADAQVDVVVDDEVADREDADEGAEFQAGEGVSAEWVDLGLQDGDGHDADEDGNYAEGHDLHHLVFGAVEVGVLFELGLHGGQSGEHDEAVDEVGDGGGESGEEDVEVVHGCLSGREF